MNPNVLGLDTESYQRSELHGQDRIWVETNCYVDLWIEVLHALGVPPQACAAFTLSIDFDDDQFSFFKYPLEDLRFMWGLDVNEMNPWLPLEEHLEVQLAKGRLMTVEIDSWYLPDTAGVSYQIEHVKTSIAAQMIDREAQRLGYFHGQSYYEITGADYQGALRLTPETNNQLPPYTELVKLDRFERRSDAEIAARAWVLIGQHLERRPTHNPVAKFRRQFHADLPRLIEGGGTRFHGYAFATLRQLGAAAEMAASLTTWLESATGQNLRPVTDDLIVVSSTAKSAQFKMARAATGRPVDFEPMFDQMQHSWGNARDALESHYGG